ncbi:reverse transcriptase domain-containing protein, partial [Tanacetum coccineum]
MSTMANPTPIVTTVTKTTNKEKAPDAAPRVNIRDFCEEHYKDILPIIMEKARCERALSQQSVHERLSDTYSGPGRTDSREPSHSRGHSHRGHSHIRERSQTEDRSRDTEESYGDTYSQGITCKYRNQSRNVKKWRESESTSSRRSESSTCNGGHWKSNIKRRKLVDEDDLGDPEDHLKIFQAADRWMRWAMLLEKELKTLGRHEGSPLEASDSGGFMHGVNNPELTKRLNEHVSKTMEEMMTITTAFIRGEAAVASKKKGHLSWKSQDHSKRQATERKSDFRSQPGIRNGGLAVPSTAYGMLKFPIDGGIVTIRSTILIPVECVTVIILPKEIPKEAGVHRENLKVAIHSNFPDQEVAIGGTLSLEGRTELCTLLKKNLDIFAWHPSDMIGVPRSIAEHRLNIQEGYSPVRQKKRVMVKKHDGSWRMCVDFTDLNKACPQDCYPLLEIDWKIESLCGYPFKCFLDAYKGYHQIQMVESDEEKTAFHTGQGVYCNKKNAFWSKKCWRLVDKAFDSQVGRNMEVYVDDLVIKSHTEAKMLRDIDETFCTLRKINMKLNPKKCTFGAVEGMFLGYTITPEGIKSCPNKTEAVLQLPSPRTIKEVQSLNGKLASLNRFFSKSAEKSLPLFKTLKKCIKSDFHWTPEA